MPSRQFLAVFTLIVLFAPLAGGQVGSSQVQKFAPAAPIQDEHFGFTIAQSDNRVAIGAPHLDGAVDVYRHNGATWVFEDRLVSTGALPGISMGFSVATDGDVIVAGAPDNTLLGIGAGAAWVFRRTGSAWSQESMLTASDGSNDHLFGSSVAIDGDRILVGALTQDVLDTPGAYVFRKDPSGWIEEQKLTSSDIGVGASFGHSVDLDGNLAFVGSFVGTYIFERTGTVWTQQAKLLEPEGSWARVAHDSGTLVIGIADAASEMGVCRVYTQTGTTWILQRTLMAGDRVVGDQFGDSVSIEGDWITVGAPYRDEGHAQTLSDSGAVYVYQRDGTTWDEVAKLVQQDAASGDGLGDSVSILNSRVLCGAPRDNTQESESGSVYFFDLAPDVIDSFLCFSDGGCTNCPCANNSMPGTGGGCVNSGGRSALLIGSGDPSESNDRLRFDLTGANESTFGVLVSADNLLPQNGPCPPASGVASPLLDGLRCVGGALLRHGSRATNPIGNSVRPWSPLQGIIMQGGFTAGDTRHFQVFYREDVALGCNTGQNTSSAVSITFTL